VSSDRTSDAPLWAGRFSTAPASEAAALGRSVQVDLRLAAQDVEASIAHVGSLKDAGILDATEARTIEGALVEIGREIVGGRFAVSDADEDVHSVVERAVTERLGDLGAKLHTGRSRNDLVVTDLRLWLLGAARRIDGLLAGLIEVLVARGLEHPDTPMPGTTHGRFAQPVTLGHHLLAHAWGAMRDLERLEAWATRASTGPLGAGAISTSTLGLDPEATSRRLGFRRVFENSIDAVSDRDFVQEFVAVASICATHGSRLAADLTRWTDPSLGWAELDESYSTGSSMMPQKRNPDAAELARGKAARIAGDFTTITTMLQGLPLGYHRDLQEDKEPAFDAADTLELVLPALTGMVGSVAFRVDAMLTACADEGLYATDLAESLAERGMPFREAHRRTGDLLKRLEAVGRGLRDLTIEEWSAFGLPDGRSHLDPVRSIQARAMPGGPSRASVLAQADVLTRRLTSRSG
jgi:argininosuccinate lyase